MPTLNSNQIYAYAVAAGVPGNQVDNAVATALAESSGRTDVVNPFGNTGLWQMGAKGTKNDSGTGYTEAQLKDPATNAAAMVQLGNQISWDWKQKWSTWLDGSAQIRLKQIKADVNYMGNRGPVGGVDYSSSAGGLSVPGLSGIDAVGADLDKVGKWITTPASWEHVLYVVGGGVMLLIGLYTLTKPITAPIVAGTKKAVATTKKVAATAAKVGAV